MSEALEALNKILDKVLAYRPKSKDKKARKVKQRKKVSARKRD